MPIARTDAVGITLYGGTILPGNRPGHDEYLTQQSVRLHLPAPAPAVGKSTGTRPQ